MNNFIGKDGFYWWVGVVEKRDDPLGLGRCKVRIFGWHSDNLNELPTDSLPWALPVNSPNNSKSFEAPREGEYVMGFFQDGAAGQAPIMTGVFAGIQAEQFNRNKGFSPQGPTQNVPVMPVDEESNQVGQPNTPPLARGVVDKTNVAKSNSKISHVCDITGGLRYSIAWISLQVSSALRAIREALKALWAGSSASPFADEVRNVIKTIKAEIKQAQKFIKNQLAKLSVIKDVINKIQRLIAYIQSLPAKLAKFVKQCLTEAMASVKDAIKSAEVIVGSSDSAAAEKLADATQTQLDNTTPSTAPSNVSFNTP